MTAAARSFSHPTLFISEDAARQWLQPRLEPHFFLLPEVRLKLGNNRLRIDWLAAPRPPNRFLYPFFGIELKRGLSDGGDYCAALHQSVDYTHATIDDRRCTKTFGMRLANVYLFPGMPDQWPSPEANMFRVNRLIGRFHVGLIYEHKWSGLYFAMCADRQWTARDGPLARKHNTRNRVGSGGERK